MGAFIITFLAQNLGFQTTFRVIFADDKRKAVLIRGFETPFWNAEKMRSDTRLSQKHVSVEVILNAKLFWNAFIISDWPTIRVCPTWSLLYNTGL